MVDELHLYFLCTVFVFDVLVDDDSVGHVFENILLLQHESLDLLISHEFFLLILGVDIA